jgi:hypothetical protein
MKAWRQMNYRCTDHASALAGNTVGASDKTLLSPITSAVEF